MPNAGRPASRPCRENPRRSPPMRFSGHGEYRDVPQRARQRARGGGAAPKICGQGSADSRSIAAGCSLRLLEVVKAAWGSPERRQGRWWGAMLSQLRAHRRRREVLPRQRVRRDCRPRRRWPPDLGTPAHPHPAA
jgi:hypothetical protein